MDTQNTGGHEPSPMGQSPKPLGPEHNNKLLFGVLAYLGPLVIVSYFMAKQDPFVKFHIKQGLVVFCIEIIVWILSSIFWQMWMVINIVNLGTLVLSVIGIINVLQNQEKQLPLVGQFGAKFPV